MNEVWFSWADLCEATAGAWLGESPSGQVAAGVSSIVDDSRAVTAGALFVAIPGESVDGHRFVLQAARAGAAGVCVSQTPPAADLDSLRALGCAVLRVPDTLAALQQLACRHRRSLPALLVVGITGSCGKTSTKEMLAAVLERRYPGAVLKTEGNTNNHFGVPRNLLRLARGHRAAVIEIGTNHPGEVATLARLVQPDIGVVSNIGAAHLEFFGDLAGVAAEKGELLALTAATGLALFHGDAPHADVLRAKAGSRRTLSFGADPSNDVVVTYRGLCGAGSAFTLHWRRVGVTEDVEWSLCGAHQALNAGAAAALGHAVGMAPAEIAAGLRRVALPAMRTERRTVDGVHWVNDAYNANPDSTRAGVSCFLELSAEAPPEARLLVLGDMLEQGAGRSTAHRDLLQWVVRQARGAEVVVVGALMAAAATELGLRSFADSSAAGGYVRGRLAPGLWVFVKGSRGLRLEHVLPLDWGAQA